MQKLLCVASVMTLLLSGAGAAMAVSVSSSSSSVSVLASGPNQSASSASTSSYASSMGSGSMSTSFSGIGVSNAVHSSVATVTPSDTTNVFAHVRIIGPNLVGPQTIPLAPLGVNSVLSAVSAR